MRKPDWLDWLLIAALVAAFTWIGVQANIDDHRLDRLQARATAVEQENAELRAKIAHVASLAADLADIQNKELDDLDSRVSGLESECQDLDTRLSDVESILSQYNPSSC